MAPRGDRYRFERPFDIAVFSHRGIDSATAFLRRLTEYHDVVEARLLVDAEEGSPKVGRGDEVRITLWNVSTDVQHTGNRHEWYLQVLTMDGWQDIRGTTGEASLGYDDVALEQRPGKAFEWSLEMTEEGVLKGHVHEDALEVCPDLQPGRYRFVYNGIVSGESLGVEFHYEG